MNANKNTTVHPFFYFYIFICVPHVNFNACPALNIHWLLTVEYVVVSTLVAWKELLIHFFETGEEEGKETLPRNAGSGSISHFIIVDKWTADQIYEFSQINRSDGVINRKAWSVVQQTARKESFDGTSFFNAWPHRVGLTGWPETKNKIGNEKKWLRLCWTSTRKTKKKWIKETKRRQGQRRRPEKWKKKRRR